MRACVRGFSATHTGFAELLSAPQHDSCMQLHLQGRHCRHSEKSVQGQPKLQVREME